MLLTQTQELRVYRRKEIQLRRWLYPSMLALIYVTWYSYMLISNSWHLFQENWPVSLTMTLGSFVAGATAEGGAAVAFPVFTKALHIPAHDARTFGLMIQAVGMTMAGVMIFSQRVRVLGRVILWVSLGGVLGQVLGTYLFHIPLPYPKILFTFISTVFGLALIISRWQLNLPPNDHLPSWNGQLVSVFLACGVFGGIFAANTGSGIDMLTFVVLTLAFGINEKISTPTTVIIMAINSIVGFFLHGVVSHDIGVAWDYWLVAVPIVIIGAPLGAYVAAHTKRDHIIMLLLSLITVELVTTIWLVPFTATSIAVTAGAVITAGVLFAIMMHYREQSLATVK